MIQITPQMRILVAVDAQDFRKGIDGLARICREVLEADPFGGTLVVFRNRRGTAIKCLVYDSCDVPDYGEWRVRRGLPAVPTNNPLHIIGWTSERLKPFQHRGIRSPGRRRGIWQHRSRPFQGFAFRFEVNRRIPIGRFDAGVPQPVTDGHQVDSGTQQMHSRAVPPIPHKK